VATLIEPRHSLRTEDGLQVEWPTYPVAPPPPKPSPFSVARELPVLLVLAFGLALVLKLFLLQAFYIPSGSMEPTLHGCHGCNGDRVLVNKLAYRFREPTRGEIIVFVAQPDTRERSLPRKIWDGVFEAIGFFTPMETDYIKRIIGEPGDTVEVTDAGVFITPPGGKRFKLNEPYILSADQQGPAQEPFVVPADHFFVMGDNRANSSDSRSQLGPVKRERIIGKAFVRMWPLKRIGLLPVPEYSQPAARAATTAAPADPIFVPLVALAALHPVVRRRAVR